ncbi:unnamed protein product [Rotaria sordida]|uniref:Uncharacterized protein n=1 Tax=Rotaria sordida TaxID=392033 RepID=A0A819PDJ7_9BILA|nr:unnamed protein product [Rotaria sordida]
MPMVPAYGKTTSKLYYLRYISIDRLISIVFIHNYLLIWSIAIFCSLILPVLFIFAPSSLRTTRTSHFLIICIVCLSNMCSLYVQAYMISGKGEPNLSYHTCRFIVYISTFAKPIGIYLTLLFSIERLLTKILSKFLVRFINHRQLCQRLYTLLIFLITIIIVSIRLFEVLNVIIRNQSVVNQTLISYIYSYRNIKDTSSNSTDRSIKFKYCFNSMNIDRYAKFLSFYVIQYWFEQFALIIIILILLIFIIHQYCLPRIQQRNLPLHFSVNTKLYLSLASCVIASELILLFCHFIIDNIHYNNRDVQITSLQLMLFAFNFRCIFLPCIVLTTTCDPLKQFLFEIFISRPYLDDIDENDTINTINNQSELFSSTQQTSNRLQQKFRHTFTKNKTNNNDEYFDNEESHVDF